MGFIIDQDFSDLIHSHLLLQQSLDDTGTLGQSLILLVGQDQERGGG